MIHKKLRRPLMLASVAALAISALGVVAADETIGTVEVTGGSLTMSAPATHTFGGVTLNGTNQTITDSLMVLGVNDARGSGAGWNLSITSTTFKTADATPKTLSTAATKVTAMVSACAAGTCTDPTNGIGYPLTVPAGDLAPTAVKLFNAAINTGLGDFDLTPTVTIDIPANTLAGTYTSTITTTVSTGP